MGVSHKVMEVREVSAKYDLQATKLGVPVGYKQTDVGVIPEGWDVKRLGEIGILSKGKGLLKEDIKKDGAVPAIPYTALYTDFSEVVDYRLIKWFVDDIAGTVVLNEPCVLIASSSNMAENTGKASALVGDKAVAVGREVIIFKSTSSASYISYLLSTSPYRKRTLVLARGTTIKHLYPATFVDYKISLPSIPEQRAIATALSDMDALLDSLDQLITKKRDLKQAAMQQLLTGKTRLPGFEGEWEVKRLGDLGRCLRGVSYRGDSDLSQYDTEQTKRLLRSNNVQNANVMTDDVQFVNVDRVAQQQILSKHDILICMANGSKALVGKSGLFTINDGYEYTFGAFMGCFRTNSESANSNFVFCLFQTGLYRDYINNLLAGSSINNLRPSSIESLEFSVPPLDEQTAIATVLSDMGAEIDSLEQRRHKTRDLKQAMMQELLTGRTRLINPLAQDFQEDKAPSVERKANVHFMRSVLAAEIINQLHEEPTFGHVKFEKMLFLVEHLCEVDTGSTYRRQAAGPYDNKALRSIDSQLKKQQWFDARKDGGRYRYLPLDKQGGHKAYFDRYFSGISSGLKEIVETFRAMDTERCEIVATLFSAWSDLLREKGTVSDDMIVHEVLNHWHESKKRIAEDRWLNALNWMRKKGFVPKRCPST